MSCASHLIEEALIRLLNSSEHSAQAKAGAPGGSWLESAVTCYLQAMRHGSAAARATMPRILNLFSFQDASGAVSAAIRKAGRQVRAQCWVQG